MKRVIFISLLSFFTFKSYGDTIDFWYVYYNDSIIGNYHSKADIILSIDKLIIQDSDSLFIEYHPCPLCVNCDYVLIVSDEKRRKVDTFHNYIYGFPSFAINIKDILNTKIEYGSRLLDFYIYQENEIVDLEDSAILLRITFE